MSERAVYTIKRGDPVQFILATAEGESISGYTATAKLRKLPGGINSYTPSPTVSATFTVTSDYAGGDTLDGGTITGPGWYLRLSAAATDLDPGCYLADALVDGPSTDDRHTEPWVVQVQEVVT